MKVFLSSTYIDLKEHRSKAAEAVARLDQEVGRMETFGARPDEPQAASLLEVGACDLFVGIYAHRYGYIPRGSEMSITEAEFREARSLGKRTFCFVIQDDHPWPDAMVEEEPGGSKLRAFKAEIGTDLVTDRFTTPEDLGMKVGTSLGRYILSFAPVVDQLRTVIESNSASHASRRAVDNILLAVVDIANRTFRYTAERRSSPINRGEEAQLSQGWQNAAMKLLALPKPPPMELVERYFLKAEYWSDPERWTDERVAQARIGLQEVADESRRLLLAMQLPEN